MSSIQANFSCLTECPPLPPPQNETSRSYWGLKKVKNAYRKTSISPPVLCALNFNQNLTDWSYNMRREMQEIIPGLFLGPYAAATKSKVDVLQRLGITHIVCVRHGSEANFIHPNFPDIFSYLVLDIADSTTEIIVHHLPQFNSFVDQCLQCNGKVLVHGNAGISRSAALVIGYIMEKFGQRYKFAFNYVQQQRFCINLNLSFEHQLYEYEKTLFARREVDRERYRIGMELQSDVGNVGQLKRKLHVREEEDIHSSSAMT